MDENRRAYERYGTDMIFWIKPHASDRDFQPFEIKNISGGGILCRTREPFTVGNQVLLSFELPQHTDLIEARAVIRHVAQNEDGNYDVGLQFLEVEGLPTSLLIDYLEELFE